MVYELLVAEKEEIRLCFRLSGEAAERCGAIGYLRADFGRSGKEFYSTRFDCGTRLKSSDFKNKFDELINSLRDDGHKPPFASRDNHLAFCTAHPSMTCFKITTLDYSFYIRLNPHKGTYDIYCFAYDNRWLLPELAGKHDLPEFCYSTMPSSGDIVIIKNGEKGYYRCEYTTSDAEYNREYARDANIRLGVTRTQEEAMLGGSMCGWNTDVAKPWNYDDKGNLRKPLIKNKDDRDDAR